MLLIYVHYLFSQSSESCPKHHLIDSERLTAKVICAFPQQPCSRCGNIFASGTTGGGETSFVCINQHRVHLSAVLKRVRAGECILEKFSWTCDKEPGFSMITFGLQGCGDGFYLYCDCISGDIIRLYILIGLLKECASGFQLHNSPGIREKL